jgi:hypothetical protein
MKLKITAIIFVIVFCALASDISAQEQPTARKIFDLPAGTSDKMFHDTVAQLLKTLKRSPSTTTSFIAIYDNAAERESYMKALMKKSPSLADRIDFSHPGTTYDNLWSSTEFWIVPGGARPPYQPMTSDVACPTIDISGPWAAQPDSVLTFTAELRGGPQVPIRYDWTLEGGTIVRNNKVTVEVRINADTRSLVTKLEVSGLPDDFETCPKTAVHETRVISH